MYLGTNVTARKNSEQKSSCWHQLVPQPPHPAQNWHQGWCQRRGPTTTTRSKPWDMSLIWCGGQGGSGVGWVHTNEFILSPPVPYTSAVLLKPPLPGRRGSTYGKGHICVAKIHAEQGGSSQLCGISCQESTKHPIQRGSQGQSHLS